MWEKNGSPVNSCVRLTASCLNQNGSSVEMLGRKQRKPLSEKELLSESLTPLV
jgi:hypothetical protein